ncbi:response regulator [Cupriavidus alkaliphilus]|uniref:DNA-binding response OmpR family regulator n=1 Tax=Cupriavidus alkaliphilus TaxID=942866 RepID=A0A1C3VM77_9BURK|nr:response regulator [Cupriavidus alkaliphilus]MBB2920568.1 DNA-binding response OmpR family regulator [Cupriavidus alkaliphilus]MBB3010358.1 DNA-binding response OmpR family regulator [Cupriavidus alkaliphilus]MBB3016072.1 DNA-binding response OmpR family regulator [Cupriavidus alkaliphilus]PVY76224.1 response regulator receiver domain-containing protein [Cupriavidus alkaliphilus]RAS05124.1 response regulator receiver domain-containing protein [Cupriavidus alkaliphilus]
MSEQDSNTSYRALNVLLIEDSAVLRGMLLEYLKDFPFVENVDWADTEAMALRLLAAGTYDVAIVDLQLRQGNGINVLRAMQRANNGTVRIVYTNHAQLEMYRRQCAEAGADYFFDKSLELEQVFRVIEEHAAPQP